MIVIVDYGMGNLRNVRRAVEACGGECVISSSVDDVVRAGKIILPGVGAFGEAVKRIDRLGLRDPLLDATTGGKPLLGICLGMQLLFDGSEESPGVAGFGIIPGAIVKFDARVKVPHIGWNDVTPTGTSPLFPDAGGIFYFVHSYHLPSSPFAVATTEYGTKWVSAVARENVCGVQFHPEKSQEAGMGVLRGFLGMRDQK